ICTKYSAGASILFIFLSGENRSLVEGRGSRLRQRPRRPRKVVMLDLAIVGGGPGGLMTAWHIKKKLGALCKVTIFEASERVGGKVLTGKFDSANAIYEAGVAEIYDYSMVGPDPLRDMVQHLGLQTIPMDAEQVQLDGELLNDVPGMRRKYGPQ